MEVHILSIKKLLLASLVLTCLLTGCNQTDDGPYVTPITLSEKIHGNWTLESMTQIDELSQTNMDLSGQLNFLSFGISLNVDDALNPTTYLTTGNAPQLIPLQGYWEMAHNFTNADNSSSKIYLFQDQGKKVKLRL